MFELYTFRFSFSFSFLKCWAREAVGSPFGTSGLRGTGSRGGSSPRHPKGGSGPRALGSSEHPVTLEMGLGGRHKDTGEHTASTPVPPSVFFGPFLVPEIQFQERRWPSRLVPVFTADAAVLAASL